MANDLMIKKRTKVIKERMTQILKQIDKEHQQGKFKSEVELQYRITKDLQAFYNSIGATTLNVVQAWGPPFSSDHNQMISQIYNDISSLYEESKNLTVDIAENFEQVELERKGFERRILEAESKVKAIESTVDESKTKFIFRDDFIDTSKLQADACKLPAAHISTDEGILTLARSSSDKLNDYAVATILDGNGFPGTSHVVRSTGDGLKFDGEDGLHINLADILDLNNDTWFEYEGFEITNQVREAIEGKGLAFREGIEWLNNSLPGGLQLALQIKLPKSKTMNWFSLTPYLSSDKGSSATTIEKIRVSDGKGTIYDLGVGQKLNETKGFLFPKIRCQTITIYLKQMSSYEIDVGHFYFKQLNKEDITFMKSTSNLDGVLTQGEYPSLTNLGITYDFGKQEMVYPAVPYGNKIDNEETNKVNLFTIPAMSSNIFSGIERILAKRFMIGLRDINMASYQFVEESEYVSVPFVSTEPIREVSLTAEYDIPDNFPKTTDWIQFYISTNSGTTWSTIHPRDTYKSAAKTSYLINSGTPIEARLSEVGYIDELTDITEIQVRIVTRRPIGIEDSTYYTPVVYGYELHTDTQGGIV